MNVGQLKDDIEELVRSIEEKARNLHNEIFQGPGEQKFKPEIHRHKRTLKAYDSLLTDVQPMMKDISDRMNANAPTYEFSIKTIRAGLKHLRTRQKDIEAVTKNTNNTDSDEAYYIDSYKAFLDEITATGESILDALESVVRGGGRSRRTRRNRRSK